MTAARDRPWVMRTYAGHTSAAKTNALFRDALSRGQTGLSVAFDLPTQTGRDPDDPLSRGEVGRVGVPIAHLGDLERLFEGLAPADMDTSMTINATAPWLLALYCVLADRRGAPRRGLRGTVQNDLAKEFLARGTYMLPPGPSLRLQTDLVAFAIREMPRWNPINVCSYHLQEAGATPVLEVAIALANATSVLDALRARPDVPPEAFPEVFGRVSFFVNAGIRFVSEMVKLRVMARMWDRIGRERYGVEDPKLRRFRYGVQVGSLGLTEAQPENNVHRIALETLGVVLSKNARARAVQLPAWNEALGLPRPWDQQWSLRLQQVLAYETDVLEHGDLFDGSPVVARLEDALEGEVEAELRAIEGEGGLVASIESGALKEKLVLAQAERLRRIATGEDVVVGVNRFTEGLPSPLVSGGGGPAGPAIETVGEDAEPERIEAVRAHRASRDRDEAARALDLLREAAAKGEEVMGPSLRAAAAGVTTGEWGAALREVFGDYRAPTGVTGRVHAGAALEHARREVDDASRTLGRRLKLLVGKPGLDGHSNGAEQVAVAARDAGIEVVYEGIRLTPEQIARAAEEEGVHAIGLSILSGSHLVLVPEVLRLLAERGLGGVPVVVGGIVPEADREVLRSLGVARVYTPVDHDLARIMAEIATLAAEGRGAAS